MPWRGSLNFHLQNKLQNQSSDQSHISLLVPQFASAKKNGLHFNLFSTAVLKSSLPMLD